MSNFDHMLESNKNFAAQQSVAGTLMPSLPSALPNVKAVIIGCADMRVDPAHVLGIRLGEAVVMRNIGGRVTPGLLEQLGLLGRIGESPRRFLEAAESFTSSYFSIRILASPALRAIPPCGRTIFNTGQRTQEKSGHRSARGDCSRHCFAPGGSRIAGRVASLRSRL
jgi:hypothetical protein